MGNDQSCPWSSFAPGTLKFCEAHLCSWVVAPAETYSNALYLLVGAWLILRPPKTVNVETPRVLGAIAITVGFFSALYHASHLWLTETFDLGSMSLLAAYLLCHALVRVGWLERGKFWLHYGYLIFLSWIALALVDGPPRLWIFASMIFLYVYLEGFLAIRARRLGIKARYSSLFWTLGIFVVSYAFWLTDFYRWSCDPSNHFFSGHAGWHVLNAFCFVTLSIYLGQFGENPAVACAKASESLR